jgi:TonB family protein
MGLTQKILLFTSLIVVALLWTGSLQAQNPLQRRISVTYQGATPASVFQAIADVLGHRLQLDGKVSGSVTLDVRNVSVETALRAVCESIGCRWRIDNGALVVARDATAIGPGPNDTLAQVSVRDVYENLPVDIQWNAAPAEAAITALARMLGAEPLIDRALTDRRISLSLSKETARAALNAICDQAGCRWRLADAPKRILRVIDVPPAGALGVVALSPVAPFEPEVARARDAGVTAPKLLSQARPRYAPAAMRARIQGTVSIEFVVETDGTVGKARVTSSLDKVHGLDAEALIAARLYLFEPGTKNGKPVPVVGMISINFTLR